MSREHSFAYILHLMFRYWLILLLFPVLLFAGDPPTLSKGRFRPYSVHAKLWMRELYGRPSLKKEHRKEAPHGLQRGEDILWDIQTRGTNDWENFPLIAWQGGYVTPAFLREIKTPESEEKLALFSSPNNLRMIPYPAKPGEWGPLKLLGTPTPDNKQLILQTLWDKYDAYAGKPYRYGALSTLSYPSKGRLIAESLYYHLPLLEVAIVLYVLAALSFHFRRVSFTLAVAAFLLHSTLLLMRIYILGRPPVANMFETLLYVPWVIMILSYKRPAIGAVLAASLLTLAKTTGSVYEMENVQAVLDSGYWLTIHVLMIVASYGAFLLSAAFAHIELWRPSPFSKSGTLNMMYIGTALLIPGTILGGVWAAESWGRFWDWDPKESWAFISSCLYLAVIHAYRFGHIGAKGVAIGSILGFQAILFTWYGVNYLLGTGLHSYGFGSGGEIYYFLFIGAEALFLIFSLKKIPFTHKI